MEINWEKKINDIHNESINLESLIINNTDSTIKHEQAHNKLTDIKYRNIIPYLKHIDNLSNYDIFNFYSDYVKTLLQEAISIINEDCIKRILKVTRYE